MEGFPKEINVVLGRSDVEKILKEEWGPYDLFRKAIIENNDSLAKGLGIKLARPFYEKFVMQLLMFDDVFRDFEELNEKNEVGLQILHYIKTQLVGQQYQKLSNREQAANSVISIEKELMDRIVARRVERGSIEEILKRRYVAKQYTPDETNYVFTLKGDKEMYAMRDALSYAAMVEALQTSSKVESREIGDRLAKENYIRIMIAHHILDAREGFVVKGSILDMVRKVLDALDRDDNGLLSLRKASHKIDEDVSSTANPELWKRLSSYDVNGDGFLTSTEQVKLKEAIARVIQQGVEFRLCDDDTISFEEVDRVLSKALPINS